MRKECAEMSVYHELIHLATAARPSFYDVTEQVEKIVSRSGIRDGIVVVYSQHTTCSMKMLSTSKQQIGERDLVFP